MRELRRYSNKISYNLKIGREREAARIDLNDITISRSSGCLLKLTLSVIGDKIEKLKQELRTIVSREYM